MSIGMFLGITPSFLIECQRDAKVFIAEINKALSMASLPPYYEPDPLPDPYTDGRFGRSALDHNGEAAIVALHDYCQTKEGCPNLGMLAANPYRTAFLPASFSLPIETGYIDQIGGEAMNIWIGSLPTLREELCSVATRIGIPLEDGNLSDVVAQKINDYESLSDEDGDLVEDRTAWLMLYEGSRLAVSFNVALSLAG